MKKLVPWRRYLISFIVLFICLILYDYFIHKSFNWVGNSVKSLLFVLFSIFFDWAFSDKGKRDNG